MATLRGRIPGIKLLHQTGERDYDMTVAAYAKLAMPVEVFNSWTICLPCSRAPT